MLVCSDMSNSQKVISSLGGRFHACFFPFHDNDNVFFQTHVEEITVIVRCIYKTRKFNSVQVCIESVTILSIINVTHNSGVYEWLFLQLGQLYL